MSEKKSINDEELDSVAGGNRQQVTARARNRVTTGVGSQITFGMGNRSTVGVTQQSGLGFGKESVSQNRSISRNKRFSGQCEPEDNEENSLQKPTCSDPTNRGKKPECAHCSAGII